MSSKKSTASKSRRSAAQPPITLQPAKGFMVSTGPNPYPETVDDKITVAASITKAVIRSLDSEGSNADDLDFDPHWPLSMAVKLMELASLQLDRETLNRKAGVK
ncbi:MAG: hypothetical protein WDO56_35075 [Gammaproteobacteria bacterium]